MSLRPSPHATAIPSGSRRAVIVVIGLLLVVHSVLVMLWVMPSNPMRDAVGEDNLHSYIDNPVVPFEQSWSIFAPVPRRAGENVKVRAVIGGRRGASDRVTPWYDITGDEDARIRHLVNPSRIHAVTRRLGGDINDSVRSFTTEQQRAIGHAYPATRDRLRKQLVAAGTGGAGGTAAIDAYLVDEEMLVRFGTMYATARWGEGVTAVEFMVGHRRVPDFDERERVDLADVPFSYQHIGRRRAVAGDAEAQAAFDAYVRRAATPPTGTGE